MSEDQTKRFLDTDIRFEENRIKQLKKDIKVAENEARYKKIWLEGYKEKLKKLKERRDKLQ